MNMNPTTAASAAWQNDHRSAASVAAIAQLDAESIPVDISRGMVVTGTVAEVAAHFTGTVTLGPSSFSSSDAVAAAFARLDTWIGEDEVRVIMVGFAGECSGIRIDGDPSFSWEGEWVLAGTFETLVEVDEDRRVVEVTIAPAG